jgi:hypothetical protein
MQTKASSVDSVVFFPAPWIIRKKNFALLCLEKNEFKKVCKAAQDWISLGK